MVYAVKEIFMTLQGEGAQAGRPAVFLRFTGCNLWNGLEKDREFAVCQFCDTDFVGTDGINGGKFKNASELADAVVQQWSGDTDYRYVVITGGEPLLQLDTALIDALHALHFTIAIETNGTIKPPDNVDWICMSPKAGSDINVFAGHELKFIYPQDNFSPEIFENLKFDHFYIQAKDGIDYAENLKQSITFCHKNPKWHLSVQTHKLINIP
ncbi:MAG: 7-carboxy-7-deazaguanine synthase (Cx14CxxC type) [Alphaproteobacteria bacterium]|jgi:7-carboxy-7-deazaguanine synthase (Cx14CxxC type)